jgi:nitrate/nitrite transporter NarK
MHPRVPEVWRLACLVFAGEAIFSLPFHVPRFFRPTLLVELGLDNAALGDVFAVYGLTAMLAYFPGGALADRFPPRILLALSLWATAAGGLVLASRPSLTVLAMLYGYWGITTILLFWAALMRATREWGGPLAQGRAFGLLEGGRGAVAALLAGVGLSLLSGNAAEAHADPALVIRFYAAMTALAGLLCWVSLPAGPLTGTTARTSALPRLDDVRRNPRVWLLALVVAAAYCGYKAIDYYTLHAQAALGDTALAAERRFAQLAWLRPLAAITAGYCADRLGVVRCVGALFALGAAAFLLLGSGALTTAPWLLSTAVVSLTAIYALRGIYFALVAAAGVPPAATGTAVGVVSVIGYTPDAFFAPLAGRLLDGNPGLTGFAWLYGLLGAIFAIGAIATLAFARIRGPAHGP